MPPPAAHSPSLSHQRWTSVSFHHVRLAFLRAEWHKIPGSSQATRFLIDRPDLTSHIDNERRRCLLEEHRAPLLRHVPHDTSWFEVNHLFPNHLEELLVIGRCGWDSPDDGNQLALVAKRCPRPLQDLPHTWAQPIFWGHSRRGPFTILEGNNRLVALAGSTPIPEFQLSLYIGLSSAPCRWHLPDLPAGDA